MKCVALLSLALFGYFTAGPARAGTWTELSGAEALRELISGATANIELKSGVTASGRYYRDGTAELEAWGVTDYLKPPWTDGLNATETSLEYKLDEISRFAETYGVGANDPD